mmetsp:Transcript_66381/g.126466  ORF Transcript_66381/g.126466 Transcript_66381/m.126466 type:complete len:730 (+) Transcript_66381:76-2265(+)
MEADGAPNRVRVYARVRPALAKQRSCVQTEEPARAVRVCDGSSAQEFIFDGVFPQTARQEQVFSQVGLPVVRECLKGFNGSILAYGQTGSGKTHSLLHQGGSAEESGLLPRVVNQIFDHISQDPASVYEVEAAAVQVYNEQVDDLLHPHHKSGNGHNLHVESCGDVPGLTWLPCRKAGELSRIFSRARTNLVYAETKMNKASSRSHAVFQIKITKHGQSDVTFSRLSIVDLAGSERVKKSGVDGVQFKEATAINKSLLAFGNVVSALMTKKRHVPFRDSKLTHILSPCIGNNCKTSLLVCTSPAEEHTTETLCSLEFASRAMRIEVNARVNRMVHLDAADRVTVHQVRDSVMKTPEDELAGTKKALAEAAARREEAHAQVATANEEKLRAVERAEQAEARALAAEEDAREWQARFHSASAEVAFIKAANAVAESRAQTAERKEREWKCKCEAATQKVDSLELLLQEAAADKQVRNTQLCVVSAELEKLQGKHFEGDLYKQESAHASEAARFAAARASHLEAESQKATAAAKAEVAAAKAEQARALHVAQKHAFEREQSRAMWENSRATWREACDQEEERLTKWQKSLKQQQQDVMQCAGLVEGLEVEKQEVAKLRKQLEEERQALKFDRRRIQNSVLGKAPPIKSFSEKPVSLSKMLANDREEKARSHGNLRSSSESSIRKSSLQSSGEIQIQLCKSPSGSALVSPQEAQARTYKSRSRTPSRPRVGVV